MCFSGLNIQVMLASENELKEIFVLVYGLSFNKKDLFGF